MGLLDKAKAVAGQAAVKAQEGVEGVATKRDLAQAYGELGRVAYALAQRGAITHPELMPLVDRITDIKTLCTREEFEKRYRAASPYAIASAMIER